MRVAAMGNLVSALLVAVIVIGAGGGGLVLTVMDTLSREWRAFEVETDKIAALGRVKDSFGFGGMIHNFKNYILRKDQAAFDRTAAKFEEFHKVLSEYYRFSSSKEEVEVLNTLQKFVGTYDEALYSAEEAFRVGKTTAEVDALVRINDKPGIEALAKLDSFVGLRRQEGAGTIRGELTRLKTVTIWASVVSGFFLVSIVIFFLWFTRVRLVRPLVAINRAMGQLAAGDRGADLTAYDQGDEIGEMAKALNVFRDNAIEMESLRDEESKRERRVAEERRQHLRHIAEKFEHDVKSAVELVGSTSGKLQDSAKKMVAAAGTTGARSVSVAFAADLATGNVQTVAAAAEELASSFGEIARQVADSSGTARKAASEADQVTRSIAGLERTAQEISEIVVMINGIAGQTNMLALNATIEAARAGDAGKGFAVVAAEVKNLAHQTSKATEEITRQVDSIQSATLTSVEAIRRIGEVISEINGGMGAIEVALERQAASTTEISRNVLEASEGTRSVSTAIADVSQAASLAVEATDEVQAASCDLARQSELLRTGVEAFMADIRS